MIKRILILLFVLIHHYSYSQKSWTLEQCIEYAFQNNPQIKQSENNLKIANQNLLQNKASTLPTINGTATNNYNYGRNIDPFTNQYTNSAVQSNNFSLNGSLNLFNGFQTRNSIKQSRYDYMASSYDLAFLKNDISLNISASYLEVLFNIELLNTDRNQLKITDQQYERTKKLVDAGTVAQSSLYDIRAQQAQEEAQVVQSENKLQISLINLKQLIYLGNNEPFEIVKPEMVVIGDTLAIPAVDETVAMALNSQPQIKSSEYRKLSSVQALVVAKGRQSPRLSLNGSLSTLYSSSSKRAAGVQFNGFQTVGYTQSTNDPVLNPTYQAILENKPFGSQVTDNLNKFFGFTLNIPILNGYQVRTAISRAKLTAENTEYDLQIAKLTLENNIRKSHADAKAAMSNYYSYINAVKASEEAFRNTQKRFDLGLINSLEYDQSKTRLTNVQSELLRAKYDYLFKTKVLDFYRGISLKL